MRNLWRTALVSVVVFLPCAANASGAAGRLLLERHCGRCHAVTADGPSPLAAAPNLWTVLRAYPEDRLEFELAEGIGSRHQAMPQVQFTAEEITGIQAYLAGE